MVFISRSLAATSCSIGVKVVVARHQCDADVVAMAQRSFQFDRGVDATKPAAEYQDTVAAICLHYGLGRTPASVVMIFGLIQLNRPLWNRRKRLIVQ